MIHCFPELWDEASGKTEEKDYRHTRSYQYMLRKTTGGGSTSEVGTYPHRQFFGIGDDQFRTGDFMIKDRGHWLRHRKFADKPCYWHDNHNWVQSRHVYGIVPFDEFLTLENPLDYQPNAFDVRLVQGILCCKGLPLELALMITELADYKSKRRLNVPHDPFHPSNKEELANYIEYCWRILVRCDMMTKALGTRMPWQNLIVHSIAGLWSSKGCNMREWYDVDDREWERIEYVFF